MAFSRAGRGANKPPAGSTLDLSHPLARDIALCVLFNEGSGTARDISPNQLCPLGYETPPSTLSPAIQARPTWAGGDYGFAADFTGGSKEYNFARRGKNRLATQAAPCTFFALLRANGSGTFLECGMRTDSNDQLSLQIDPSNLWTWGSAGAIDLGFTGSVAGDVYSWAVSHKSATSRLVMLNGQIKSNTTSTGSATIGSTQPWVIGRNYVNASSGGRDCTGMIFAVMAWYRALDAVELRSLYAEPFQMIVPPPARRYYVAAAATDFPPRPLVVQEPFQPFMYME